MQLTRTVGATVLAAAISIASYKIYKRFFSKAARSCKEKAGLAKTSCMNKYKKDATMKKIAFLQKGFGACVISKKPNVCKAKLQQKINKEKSKLGTY